MVQHSTEFRCSNYASAFTVNALYTGHLLFFTVFALCIYLYFTVFSICIYLYYTIFAVRIYLYFTVFDVCIYLYFTVFACLYLLVFYNKFKADLPALSVIHHLTAPKTVSSPPLQNTVLRLCFVHKFLHNSM